MAEVMSPAIRFGIPPHPDRLTNRGVRLEVELKRPEVAAHYRPIPEPVQVLWKRMIAEGLPVSDLAIYGPDVIALLPEILHGHDGLVAPKSGLIALIDQPMI